MSTVIITLNQCSNPTERVTDNNNLHIGSTSKLRYQSVILLDVKRCERR